MSPRQQILSDIADVYLEFEGYPLITELGRFSSFVITVKTRQFVKDNDIEWQDLRNALTHKAAIDDNYANGLIFK